MNSTRQDGSARLAEIDILRGLVIVLMALDHARDYFLHNSFGINTLDPAQTTGWLYLTRWVTHLCAPTFVLLMGVSAYLQKFRGKTTSRLSRFLFTRGLWLIVLEVTFLDFGWAFAFPYPLFLQVIWAIGWTMIALSLLVWLPRGVVLAIGLAIVAGHNLLDPIRPQDLGSSALLWQFLHEGGLLKAGSQPIGVIAYPLLPWIGVAALGYGMGALFNSTAPGRNRNISMLGLAMLVLFFLLRGFNLYGNPVGTDATGPFGDAGLWQAQPDTVSAIMVFFNVAKYPPSLQFLLVTLGIVFAIWPILAHLEGLPRKVLLTFGSVPMFFYLIHVYLIHALAILANAAAGRDVQGLFNYMLKGFTHSPQVDVLGFPLYGVYVAWIAVLIILYPLCRWWAAVKARRRDWWLSYL